jgi:hypothetical protein
MYDVDPNVCQLSLAVKRFHHVRSRSGYVETNG